LTLDRTFLSHPGNRRIDRSGDGRRGRSGKEFYFDDEQWRPLVIQQRN